MSHKLGDDTGIDHHEKQQLVEELQLAKRGNVQSVRSAVGTICGVTVRPADSGSRQQVVTIGTTRELRARSVVASVDRPVGIGSFYELQFDSPDLPASFARCDQITMQAEDRFEVRFQFLNPITLPEEPQG